MREELILNYRRKWTPTVERALMWVVIVAAPTQDVTSSYETVFREKGHLEYKIRGGRLDRQVLEWKKPKGLKKLYLISSGARKVHVNGLEIKAQKVYRVREDKNEKVTAAISEVSGVFKKEGRYTIEGDEESYTDIKETHFQGYGLIEIVENREAPESEIVLKVGIARLKPGELYTVNIMEKGTQGQVSRFSVIGGNAKAGNGSSNLVNGVTVSGKDDWDGSSGPRWDVDDYDIKEFKILTDQGITWSIDPLLQWLYPIGAVVQVERR